MDFDSLTGPSVWIAQRPVVSLLLLWIMFLDKTLEVNKRVIRTIA